MMQMTHVSGDHGKHGLHRRGDGSVGRVWVRGGLIPHCGRRVLFPGSCTSSSA